jgi:hypothetical protein
MKSQRTKSRSRLSGRVLRRQPADTTIEHSRIELLLKGIAGFVVASTALTVAFSMAYLFMAQIYRLAGGEPAPLAKQVINSFAGLFLLVIVGMLMGRMFRSSAWAQQMNMFAPLLSAMEQIARGDFSVHVEHPRTHFADDPITKLFKGVNDMALELPVTADLDPWVCARAPGWYAQLRRSAALSQYYRNREHAPVQTER